MSSILWSDFLVKAQICDQQLKCCVAHRAKWFSGTWLSIFQMWHKAMWFTVVHHVFHPVRNRWSIGTKSRHTASEALFETSQSSPKTQRAAEHVIRTLTTTKAVNSEGFSQFGRTTNTCLPAGSSDYDANSFGGRWEVSKWDPFWSPILVSLPQRMAGKCVWCFIPLVVDFFKAIVLQLLVPSNYLPQDRLEQKIVQPRYELLWFLILHPESTSAVTLSGIIATQLRPEWDMTNKKSPGERPLLVEDSIRLFLRSQVQTTNLPLTHSLAEF